MSSPYSQTPKRVPPGSFEPDRHFYPRVLNAQIHPLVRYLMTLQNDRIAERYCHLHPDVDPAVVSEVLARETRLFRWGGADLFCTATGRGDRRIVVIETNSCPSGQKSMPILDESDEQAGYKRLLEHAFLPLLQRRSLPKGDLAVIYDKNIMEASGYAAVMADLTGETVHLVPFHDDAPEPYARFDDSGVLMVRHDTEWLPIRAAFRYVTQQPWTRIPPVTRTVILNPVVACLAGGRNKMVAAKAYDHLNGRLSARTPGLRVNVPETIWDVGLDAVPWWIERMGGVAVVKNPYSNAGQGVYTITNAPELEAFMNVPHRYGRFIVQALIGNRNWSSVSGRDRFYHVGTVPDRKCNIYVADLRFMVGVGPTGFKPIAVYARRARQPLARRLEGDASSWEMLGTNLSVKRADGGWDSESERLMLMDSRDFNRLGIGIDDLIEAYIQTVLSVTAIDDMASQLITQKGVFRRRSFATINPDQALIDEIMRLPKQTH